MMRCVMSALILGMELLNNIVADDSISPPPSMIPSKTEQANLLLNVREVFEQVKLLTEDEAHSTNISVAGDIELMVERAEYILDLLQQITQLRLSCEGNSVCSLDARPTIKKLSQAGKEALKNCTLLGVQDIASSSDQLANVTGSAVAKGEILLEDLGACSKNWGLGVISCYRGIIATDVVPVKEVLLGAVEAHKTAHFAAVEIRKRANLCVDDVVKQVRDALEGALGEALRCNS